MCLEYTQLIRSSVTQFRTARRNGVLSWRCPDKRRSTAATSFEDGTTLPKLQALVYDILPSTTAVFSYAIGSRKLSANEQFFCWYSNSSKFVTNNLNKTRRVIIAANKVYTSTNKTTIVWIETELFFFFLPGVDASQVYVRALALGWLVSEPKKTTTKKQKKKGEKKEEDKNQQLSSTQVRDDESILTLAFIFDHAVWCASAASSGWSLHLITSQLRTSKFFELSELCSAN